MRWLIRRDSGCGCRDLLPVPEPLWWLLGAIVAFYFGARETHYYRAHPVPPQGRIAGSAAPADVPQAQPRAPANPALDDWLAIGGGENRGQD